MCVGRASSLGHSLTSLELLSPTDRQLVEDVTVQWNLSIKDTTGTQLAVLYTVEPLYRGHHRTQLAVLYREVSLIQR